MSIGESSVEMLEHFGKEFQSKKYFSIGSKCVNANTLSLSCSFESTTLVDKEVDVIFCNPPLKEYEAYCKRIFEECLAKRVFLVLPMEWKSSKEIGAYAKANGFDVELVARLGYVKNNQREKAEIILFYRSYLSERAVMERKLSQEYHLGNLFEELHKGRFVLRGELEKKKEDEIAKESEGMEYQAFLEYLLKRYEKEHNDYFDNFKHFSNLSAYFLDYIGVQRDDITTNTAVFEKLLRKLYWDQCLSKNPNITSKLTPLQYDELLNELKERGADFSRSNIANVEAYCLSRSRVMEQKNFITFWERFTNGDNLEGFTDLISNPHPYMDYPKEKRFFKGKIKEKVACSYAGSYDDYYPNILRDVRIVHLLQILLQSMGYQDLHYRHADGSKIAITERIDLPLGISYLFAGERQITKFTSYKNRKLNIVFDKEVIANINLRVLLYQGWITNLAEAKEAFGTLKIETLTTELQTALAQ